jgi:hypothetical protein
VGLIAFEVRAGGVEEQQVDLEVQQIRAGEEHRFLDLALGVGIDEQIHRAVAVILADLIEARDGDIVRSPLRARPLGTRIQRAIGDHREQHTLDVGAELPQAEDPRERVADPQAPPQRVEQPHAAQRTRALDLEIAVGAERLPAAAAVGEARDRRRQPAQRVDVQLVLAAEVQQHLRPRDAIDAAVVREPEISDDRPVLAPPLRPPQVHVHIPTTQRPPLLALMRKPCAHAFRAPPK